MASQVLWRRARIHRSRSRHSMTLRILVRMSSGTLNRSPVRVPMNLECSKSLTTPDWEVAKRTSNTTIRFRTMKASRTTLTRFQAPVRRFAQRGNTGLCCQLHRERRRGSPCPANRSRQRLRRAGLGPLHTFPACTAPPLALHSPQVPPRHLVRPRPSHRPRLPHQPKRQLRRTHRAQRPLRPLPPPQL